MLVSKQFSTNPKLKILSMHPVSDQTILDIKAVSERMRTVVKIVTEHVIPDLSPVAFLHSNKSLFV